MICFGRFGEVGSLDLYPSTSGRYAWDKPPQNSEFAAKHVPDLLRTPTSGAVNTPVQTGTTSHVQLVTEHPDVHMMLLCAAM